MGISFSDLTHSYKFHRKCHVRYGTQYLECFSYIISLCTCITKNVNIFDFGNKGNKSTVMICVLFVHLHMIVLNCLHLPSAQLEMTLLDDFIFISHWTMYLDYVHTLVVI